MLNASNNLIFFPGAVQKTCIVFCRLKLNLDIVKSYYDKLSV